MIYNFSFAETISIKRKSFVDLYKSSRNYATNILITGLRSRRIRSRVLGANLTQRVIGQPLATQDEGGLLETGFYRTYYAKILV